MRGDRLLLFDGVCAAATHTVGLFSRFIAAPIPGRDGDAVPTGRNRALAESPVRGGQKRA